MAVGEGKLPRNLTESRECVLVSPVQELKDPAEKMWSFSNLMRVPKPRVFYPEPVLRCASHPIKRHLEECSPSYF